MTDKREGLEAKIMTQRHEGMKNTVSWGTMSNLGWRDYVVCGEWSKEKEMRIKGKADIRQ